MGQFNFGDFAHFYIGGNNDKRRCNPKHLKHADAYDHSQDTDIWFWDGMAMRNRANDLAAKLNPLGKGRFTGHQPVRDANCDGVPDNVDPDANGDGVANAARTNLPDTDGDGVPDTAQINLADSNGDGVTNAVQGPRGDLASVLADAPPATSPAHILDAPAARGRDGIAGPAWQPPGNLGETGQEDGGPEVSGAGPASPPRVRPQACQCRPAVQNASRARTFRTGPRPACRWRPWRRALPV